MCDYGIFLRTVYFFGGCTEVDTSIFHVVFDKGIGGLTCDDPLKVAHPSFRGI